jgi:hypothetical protein
VKQTSVKYGFALLNNHENVCEIGYGDYRQVETDSVFGVTGDVTLVLHAIEMNSIVMIVSCMQHKRRIFDATGKPEIIRYYNLTKSGVYVQDKMQSTVQVIELHDGLWPVSL